MSTAADVSDLMRRMVKGTAAEVRRQAALSRAHRLQPCRTGLSDAEARLYTAVTDYVREEFDRAEALANAKAGGHGRFRADASPAVSRLVEVLRRGGQHAAAIAFTASELDADDIADLDDAPEQEAEAAEVRILDQATAARSIVELAAVRRWRAADDADCCNLFSAASLLSAVRVRIGLFNSLIPLCGVLWSPLRDNGAAPQPAGFGC